MYSETSNRKANLEATKPDWYVGERLMLLLHVDTVQ